MTMTETTALHRVIDRAIFHAPRTLADEDVGERIADAVREHLAVEARDGYVIQPDVTAELTNTGWTVTVDGERVGQPREDVRFSDFDVSPVRGSSPVA